MASSYNQSLGKLGEELAAGFLEKNGYRILVKNYKSRLGEIDIVASDKDVLCFIEVKARFSDRFGAPQEALIKHKQRQISKAALAFLKEKGLLDAKARFDVISVDYSENSNPKIDLIKDAFGLDESFTY